MAARTRTRRTRTGRRAGAKNTDAAAEKEEGGRRKEEEDDASLLSYSGGGGTSRCYRYRSPIDLDLRSTCICSTGTFVPNVSTV